MRILKRLIIFLTAFSLSANLYSQIGNEDRKEKIEAQKVAFITNKLNLTTEEAQQFWPVYNEYQQKRRELQNNKRTYMQNYMQSFNASEEEIENYVDGFINVNIKEAELLKEYHNKYKTVLPIEKVIKLYQAENQFKHFLLKQIKGQGPGNMQGPRR